MDPMNMLMSMMNPSNPAFQQQFGNMQNFQTQFATLMQPMMAQGGMNFNAQQMIQNMMNNGQMSQEAFNQCRMKANQLMGVNY